MAKFSEDAQRSIIIFMSTMLIFTTIVYVSITPRTKELFFQPFVLGETKKLENYYPDDNSTILVDVPLKWYIGVANNMESVQYVKLRVKLGNATSQSPDEFNHTPAPLPTLVEFNRILSTNETWEIPFIWKIMTIKRLDNLIYIALNINDVDTQISEVGAENGQNFRLIFELWVFDIDRREMRFGWFVRGEQRIAWTQIWFNTTKTT